MGISPTQLIILLVIVALLFGTKKLRSMGGDLGGAVKGFKNAMRDEEKNKASALIDEQQKPAPETVTVATEKSVS